MHPTLGAIEELDHQLQAHLQVFGPRQTMQLIDDVTLLLHNFRNRIKAAIQPPDSLMAFCPECGMAEIDRVEIPMRGGHDGWKSWSNPPVFSRCEQGHQFCIYPGDTELEHIRPEEFLPIVPGDPPTT